MEKGQEISLFYSLSFSSTVVFLRALLSPHARKSGFWNRRNVYSWNLESWALESGTQLKESGIPLTNGVQNPSCTDKDRNYYLGIRSHGMESQNRRLSWIPLHRATTSRHSPTDSPLSERRAPATALKSNLQKFILSKFIQYVNKEDTKAVFNSS